MRRYTFIYFLAAFLLASFSGAASAQSEAKIGFVDLARAFDEYQKTKEFDKSLEKRGDEKQAQREKLVQEIRKMRDELEFMNEKARDRKEKDIEAKVKDLQEFDQDAKTELIKDRDDMVKDILKEMNAVIQNYGEQNGYSIILNDRVLLYGDKSQDLTDAVIRILNDKYKK